MWQLFSLMNFCIGLFSLSKVNLSNFISSLRALFPHLKCIANRQPRYIGYKRQTCGINPTAFIFGRLPLLNWTISKLSLQMAYLVLELLNLALRLILIEFHYLSKLLFLLLNVQSHLCFIRLCLLIYVLELLLNCLFDLLLHEVIDVLLGLLVQAVQVAAVFVEEVFALHVDLLSHGIGQALVLTLVE